MIRPAVSVIAVAIALALIAGAAPAPAAETGSMPWETSYGTALEKAKTSGKPILFDFTTGWCPHCTRMDKTTWKDAGLIQSATKSFVVAKINADVEKVPVSRYRLVGYPTMIVATPAGEPVLRLEGYVDVAGMKRALDAYVAKADDIAAARATLAQDRKNVPALLTIADAEAAAGLHDAATDSYGKIAKTATGADLVRAAAGAGLSMTRAGKAKEATKVLARGLEAAGASPSPALLLALAENEKALGNAEKAKSWSDRLLAEHPGSAEAKQASN